MVTAKVSPQELVTLDKLIKDKGICPNQVSDIYKLRRGRYNDVRIWSDMDLGTCRIKDLFITDVNFKPIIDFYPMTFTFESCDDDIESVLQFLNQDNKKKTAAEESTNDEKAVEIDFKKVNKTSPDDWVF